MLFTLQKNLKRYHKKYLVVLVSLYIMIGSALYLFQERLLFLPTRLEQGYKFKFKHTFEELFLETDKDALINAIHFKTDNPKGVILYFHGNAGDLSRWGKITENFVDCQYDVFVIDYRTYGKSKGKLSESALYKDAQYCYNFLLKQYSEKDISLYGRSLGTGIASYLASKNQPNQLILETPYYSILDIAKQRFPIFPLKQLLKYHLPNFEYLPKAECPITIFHGTDDNIVPIASGKKLSELNIPNLEFITITGGGHNNLAEFKDYQKHIKKVLN